MPLSPLGALYFCASLGDPPDAPIMTAVPGVSGEIIVTYTPPSDLDYISGEIEYDNGLSVASIPVTVAGVYIITGLVDTVLYRLTARAIDSVGNWSSRSVVRLVKVGVPSPVVFDARWPRWVTSSIFKHVDVNVTDVDKFFEGQFRATNTKPFFLEVRFNGPDIEQITNKNWIVKVQVDILIQCSMSKDVYKIEKMLGSVIGAMNQDIAVYQYGDSPAFLVGCLQLKAPIRVRRFGQPREREETTFVSVQVNYEMNL